MRGKKRKLDWVGGWARRTYTLLSRQRPRQCVAGCTRAPSSHAPHSGQTYDKGENEGGLR